MTADFVQGETLAVLLTGSGRGAVATVMLQGPRSEGLVLERFHKLAAGSEMVCDKPYFGVWRWEDYSEELVVCRTEESTFEIHCHGGDLASSHVLSSLEAGGAKRLSPADWVRTSVSDVFTRTALQWLPMAKTTRSAALLLDQARGALRRQLEQILVQLADGQLVGAKQQIKRLLALGHLGTRLNSPFKVVLIGPPNTGKSSLINALLGFERAIVFDQPGTTRDLVRAETAIDGWPVELIDTAGLRRTDDVVEQQGVSLAQESVRSCDLVLVIRDLAGDDPLSLGDLKLRKNQLALTVGTKVDLVSDCEFDDCDIVTSVKSNYGIESLLSQIAKTLVPQPPLAGEAVVLDADLLPVLTDIGATIERSAAQAASLIRKLLT